MEFVWMIPLYIIIPVAGIIFLFKGFNADRGQGRKKIALGIFLLSLPIIHSIVVGVGEKTNQQSLIGSYTLDSTKKVVLKLNSDKTFEFEKLDSINSSGKGKWEFRSWDIDQVDLNFNDSSQLDFEIVYQDNGKYLQNTFWTGTNHKYIKLIKTSAHD
jgi:hypothetical protein